MNDDGRRPLADLVLEHAVGIRTIAVEGTLLVDEQGQRVMPLNPTGAVLWDCIDGESPLGEIGADLADAYGLPVEAVMADVEPLVSRLLELRILTAAGREAVGPDLRLADPCCSMGTFEVRHGQGEHVHELVHAGVWLEESADVCRDERYLLGPQGEVVARLCAGDGTERLVGIRTNDLDAARVVRERLGPLLADDEPFGFPNVSILFGDRRGRVRDVNIVIRRGVRVHHSFSRDDSIDAGLALLATFADPPDGLVPVQGRAVERDGSVVLVHEDFAEALDAQRHRWEQRGHTLSPTSPVWVDPVAGVARLARGGPIGAPERESVPISHLIVAGAAPAAPGSLSAFDLARLTPLVSGGPRPLRTSEVAAMAELATRVPVVWVRAVDQRELVDAFAQL